MKNQKSKNIPSTKRFIPLAEIKNDCLIMKDGTLRAVLMISSINFALKSSEEQEAIISAYVQFLNSTQHPIQIVIQSRPFNIDKYLEALKQTEKEQVNELLKYQIRNYREYVAELVKMGSIMSKKFYMVVPYNPLSDKQKGFFSRLGELFTPSSFIKLSSGRFMERRKALFQRLTHIIGGLNSMGLSAQSLNTQELIELFYNSYNPELADSEKIATVNKIQVE